MATDTASQQTPGSKIMTFHPSMEEFKDFSRYIAYMESQGAHRAGMAKVISPKDWKPRRTYDDIDDLVIPAPIQQVVTGQSGLFTQYNIQKKPMTVREFRKTANTDKFCNPRYVDFDELERKFWKNLTFNPPLYGADVNGTLYDPDVTEWNIGHLNTILDTVERESGIKIKGVNTPYLYFGMWKSTFAWHTEDMDLYSINYLHFGEPKSWYVVPPEHGKRLERLAKGFFPGSAQSCEAFLRHKMTLISPSILKKYGIPFEKITQEAGQFIVTFPFGYHAGFNHGFNCAESTNFATQRWIDYGKIATLCSCRKDMVKISMDVFVRKFQPDRYKAWKAGKDNIPIDHSKPTPEAAEFLTGEKTGEPGKEGPSLSEASDQEEDTPGTTAQEETRSVLYCSHLPCHILPCASSFSCCLFFISEPKPEDVKNELTKLPPNAQTNRNTNASRKLALQMKANNSIKSTLIKSQPQTNSQSTQPAVPGPSSQSSEKAGPSEDVKHPVPANSPSPAHRLFQRTLSPTDVLHVHSYAKGDYSEGESKEDMRSNSSDSEAEEQDDSKVRGVEEQRRRRRGTIFVLLFLELPEQPPVEEDGLEGELWAKPFVHLWQNRPPSLKREKEYNRRMGLQVPYCSVCSLFQTYQRLTVGGLVPNWDSTLVLPGGRLRTKPLIAEMCFTTTTEPEEGAEEQALGALAPTTPHLEPDGTSLLISCSHCSVRIHTSQYYLLTTHQSMTWMMMVDSLFSCLQSCCLCSLRGGALQKANNNKWVHVLCAVAVLEARFVNITERSPVDLSGIPLQRFKLKCYYCKKRMKKTSGCCVQCSHGRCSTAYHPTCAQAAGVLMQPDEWPFVVYVTCCRHKGPIQTERNKAAMHELTVGQRVICKHKNGRYYQCDVVQLSKETFYEVNFDDGSFSDNLFPEDIVSRNCAQLGPPSQGEVVQVRWTDGLVYGAKFVAAHVIQMYQVEFEDGSQLTTKRDDVYTLDEELPKRVKSRLSKASDMRFDGIFEDKEAIQQSKRQRVINSRYRGDYIEPVIYRAIME
uniref:[histone H3]-trimethyl-L-lysine(9) demethylase n=1 Tax=Oncorhynchus tshawytscha TaxID=74940 RepID=A0A8C8M621_ONCTS